MVPHLKGAGQDCFKLFGKSGREMVYAGSYKAIPLHCLGYFLTQRSSTLRMIKPIMYVIYQSSAMSLFNTFSNSMHLNISCRQYLMPTPADETNFYRFVAGAFSGTFKLALYVAVNRLRNIDLSLGTSSVLLTYPLEVIRVRLAFETHSHLRPTLSRTIRTIYNEGLTTSTASPSSPSTSKPSSLPKRSTDFTKFPILKFYRGFAVTLIGMVPYAGTSFLVWGNLRARFIPVKHDPSNPSARPPSRPLADLVIGAIAGATSQTVSYPFEVIRRRMQVGGLVRPDRWVGFGETIRSVYRQSGWRGFYVGLTIGYLKIVPMTAVSFATWEGMKRVFDI